ncbi:MAG: DsbA family protein [Chloroflexota bacterium]
MKVNYVYFPLHPETPPEGQNLSELFGPFTNLKPVTERLKGLMDEEGLPFAVDRDMIFNSRLAQELAKWAESKPQSERLNKALYQAYFVDGLNIGDVQVLLRLVEAVGLDVEEAREVLEQRTMKTGCC